MAPDMHRYTDRTEGLADKIIDHARWRTRLDPIPLGEARTAEELAELCGDTITTDGIGGHEALRLFADVLEPNCLSVDYPRYLSFVPAAPTEAAVLFDLVVGSASIYGGSWLEGSGAAFAENEALDWLRQLAHLPDGAGGVFMPGGTIGNLSALVAARDAMAARQGTRPNRWAFLVAETAHSSVASAAAVMDADVITVPVDGDFRMTGAAVAEALDANPGRIAAVVTTAGTTNLGRIDHLPEIGEICHERNVWMHVDAAYGGAGLCAPSSRPLFNGIEYADSIIIDPHKWLFAPFDCCALLYRDPADGRRSHAQHAGYLAFLDAKGDWNPSDFGIHLTRRSRGLPFWFSLATYGTEAYAEAIQVTLDLTTMAADKIRAANHLTLTIEPNLSVVVFERDGWTADQYQAWSEKMLEDGTAFVVPSRHQKRPVFRFCFVNPLTTEDDIDVIVAALEADI